MFSLTYLSEKQEFKVFVFLLDETEMIQNNSLFCLEQSWRNDMNQVTNLKSLCFTRERIANMLGVFHEAVLCDIDFSGFFDVAFDPHISSIARFQTCQLSRFLRENPALEALIYLPHDF